MLNQADITTFAQLAATDVSRLTQILTEAGLAALADPTTWPESMTVTPTLWTLSKTYVGPEDETATGPNFPRQYRIEVDIATGFQVENLRVTDTLDDNVRYLSTDTTTLGGAPAGGTQESTPGAVGGTLTYNFRPVPPLGAYTAVDGVDAVLVYSYDIPLLDSGGAGSYVIDPDDGDDETSEDQGTASVDWTPVDPGDGGVYHRVPAAGHVVGRQPHHLVRLDAGVGEVLVAVNEVARAGGGGDREVRGNVFCFG